MERKRKSKYHEVVKQINFNFNLKSEQFQNSHTTEKVSDVPID